MQVLFFMPHCNVSSPSQRVWMYSLRTQDINFAYIRRSEDVLCTFSLRPVSRGLVSGLKMFQSSKEQAKQKHLNPFMHNDKQWPNTLEKSCFVLNFNRCYDRFNHFPTNVLIYFNGRQYSASFACKILEHKKLKGNSGTKWVNIYCCERSLSVDWEELDENNLAK